MPTWVVPSIAADFWRVPLDQVWSRIHTGAIATKYENGFTFVDVEPQGRGGTSRSAGVNHPPPVTYRGLTPDEIHALHPDAQDPCAVLTSDEHSPAEIAATPAGCNWEGTHWRDARRQVQRARRGPGAAPICSGT